MIRFREAKEDDLGCVAGFLATPNELFFFHPRAVFPMTVQQLVPNYRSREGNTVIIAGDKVAGFANFISVSEGNSATIGNVAVDPQQRGKGLGSELICHMEALAKTMYEVRKIQIPCFNTNTAGLLLYHKLGYVPCSGEPRVNQNGDPVYLIYLVKTL